MRRTSRSARRDKLEKMCAQFLQAVR
jgi:hypothetical protein